MTAVSLPARSGRPLLFVAALRLLDPAERSGVVSAEETAPATQSTGETDPALVERLAWQLLRRYGVHIAARALGQLRRGRWRMALYTSSLMSRLLGALWGGRTANETA